MSCQLAACRVRASTTVPARASSPPVRSGTVIVKRAAPTASAVCRASSTPPAVMTASRPGLSSVTATVATSPGANSVAGTATAGVMGSPLKTLIFSVALLPPMASWTIRGTWPSQSV
ncbi:hypothetical protein B5P43_15790 [Bacillus sp. SRB_336]|nr:hypothetical protein B5P43_15790 [Bacillus sp. SRB_336]